jgi:hypothetical protein
MTMCLLGFSAYSQGTKDLLTTMGTTVVRDGKNYAYLLWQPGEGGSTLGLQFAIYSKPGNASSADPYVRHGYQSLQTSVNTIRAMLELGLKVDQAGEQMTERIDGIYQEIILRPGQAPAAASDPTLDAAGKLFFLLQSSLTDSQVMSRLFLLGRAHPGVMQALGHAYLLPIASGERTYEIREVNQDRSDFRVVGRVTLDTENPLTLDAPAGPVQVLHAVNPASQYPINPKDHLNVRLRWGVDDPLRSKMPYTFGFDAFRVKKTQAEALGWHITPPTAQEMLDLLDGMVATDPDPVAARVNQMPLLPERLLTAAESAAGSADDFYCSDDGVWFGAPGTKKIRRPYVDGEQFYYFVAARTIIGAPGSLSSGTLVSMCDRQPPGPPAVVSATSTFLKPQNQAQRENQQFPQFLRVKIRQLLEVDGSDLKSDAAPSGYYVYRWSKPDDYLQNPGNPMLNRIGFVPHLPGNTFVTFDDTGAGAPTIATHLDRSVWYTARAVGKSSCTGEVLSGQSAAVAGFLRDFKAPPAPTGDFLICRYTPTIESKGRSVVTPGALGLVPGYKGIAVHALRMSPYIRAAEVEVSIQAENQSWIVIHQRELMYRSGNLMKINLPYPEPAGKSGGTRVRMRAIAFNGVRSVWAETGNAQADPADLALYEFELFCGKQCISRSGAPEPATHVSNDPDGLVNPIDGGLSIPVGQGVTEWRIYRRIGARGELSLVKKGEGNALPLSVSWQDDSPPSVNAMVCYYGQVLDQNANPSPLIPLGCVQMVTPSLPTPMLSPVIISSDNGTQASMKLEWFCDPAGVDRFEVFVADSSGQDFEIGGLSTRLQELPMTGLSADYPDDSFFVYQTNRLQGALGTGPNFSVEITVPADRTLIFAVRACGPGEDLRLTGNLSNAVEARWQTPVTGPQPVIPWPARPLPGIFDHRRNIDSYVKSEGPLWPMVMPSGYADAATGILIGLTDFAVERSNNGDGAQCYTSKLPEDYLFKVRDQSGDMSSLQSLMPFMLYRHQVPSTQHPQAKANLVQCTPLLDRISWKQLPNHFHVRDPYLTFQPFSTKAPITYPIPVSGAWSNSQMPVVGAPGVGGAPRPEYLRDATGIILLKDRLPVIAGAKYRHLIVCFTQDGEIRRVIPLNPIQH